MNAHPTGAAAASNLQSGARLALVGLAVNVAFAFIKIAAGVFGNAYALIADGIESALDAWHHRADAIISMAAAVGISLALIGGKKWQRADDYAALFACAVIATTGARLLGPPLREILDTAPRGEIIESIRRAARSVSG